MNRHFFKHFLLILALQSVSDCIVFSQSVFMTRGSVAFFDSIDRRIDYLQKQVSGLKQARDVSYYNVQRELDHTAFLQAYESYVVDEDLDNARSLVESRLERADFRRDLSSVKYYNQYKDDVFTLIKKQRIHYQQLFLKEKNFKKEFERYVVDRNPESYSKALRMVNLAIRYAQENNLAETMQYLQRYHDYVDALIFDAGSVYDLKVLTNSSKAFEGVFLSLLNNDSLNSISEAEVLLDHCRNYGKLTNSSLNGEYFDKQGKIIAAAISELFEKQGRENELSRYVNQAVTAKIDSINPLGIFKWHDQIIVIDEFRPSSAMENVKKGEAIIQADRMLATYLEKNKLCKSINELKFGYAFVIPYRSNAKNSSFYYNIATEKWQFIACYTVVNNPTYTSQIVTYMSPLFFEDELSITDDEAP
jgi:hypothetical protein